MNRLLNDVIETLFQVDGRTLSRVASTLLISISAVFQAGGLIVVLVEVMRKAYLASIVPVIVNTILNEHQVIADIVAFVSRGDFPRSRLGEKQRGKILASWVTRKMRTIAQFSIRDPDAADSSITAVPEDGEIDPSLIKREGSLPPTSRPDSMGQAQQQQQLAQRFSGAENPNYVTEQNLPYESSIVESPPIPGNPQKIPYDADKTPQTGQTEYFPAPEDVQRAPPVPSKDYFAQDLPPHDPEKTPMPNYGSQTQYQQRSYGGGYDAGYDAGYDDYASAPSYAQPDVVSSGDRYSTASRGATDTQYVPYHPSLGTAHEPPPPAPAAYSNVRRSGRGGLRVANATEEEEWPQEAILAMRQHQ